MIMEALHIEIEGDFPSYTPIPDGKGSWLSNGELTIKSDRIGRFTIPANSHNNLASIPKVVRSVISVNGPHRIASIIHDYLYHVNGKLPEFEITRKEADDVFFDAMRMSKNHFYSTLSDETKLGIIRLELERPFLSNRPLVPGLTANTMHRAVRAGGWLYWD